MNEAEKYLLEVIQRITSLRGNYGIRKNFSKQENSCRKMGF